MKEHKFLLESLLAFGLLFSGCSGGGGGSSDSTGTTSAVDKTAYFIDSPVSGLSYKSQSKSGVTGSDGSFEYTSSDKNVTFKAGAITLGTINTADINSDSKLFVQDLAGVSRDTIDNEYLLKIASFLQSLDNGTSSTSISLSQSDLDNLTEEKSINDINLTRQLNFAQKGLKDIEDVKEHLGDTIRLNGIALYNYTPQSSDLNISTLKNVVTNGTFSATDKNDNFLKYIIESNASNGAVELIANSNSFKYTPNAEFVGNDSFTYKAYDGEKYSKIATLNITVKDVPVVSVNDTTPPSAPTIVSLNAQKNSITLFWLNSTDDTTSNNEIRYEIHVSTDANFTTDSSTLKQTLINTLEADIDTLSDNTLYYIKVKAIDKSENSTISQENSIQTLLEAVVLSSAAVIKKATDLHLENAQIDGDKLVFEDSEKAEVPVINDILVGNSEDAYLKKVVAVDKNNTTTKLTVKDVAITDVVESAKLSSKVVLFSSADAPSANQSIKRSVTFKTNNTKESTTRWNSGRFSVTEITNLQSASSIQRASTLGNSDFSVTVVQDDITVVQNERLRIDVQATMKQSGIDDDFKFKRMQLLSLTHSDMISSDDFGAWYVPNKLDAHEASGYLTWTPNKNHISTEPYTATFEVFAEDTECNDILDLCNDDTETITANITVIGDGKVDTGGEITKSFDTNTEFTNDVKLDFTPTLTLEHEIGFFSVKYAKVAINGKLDFNVLSKFKYSAAATKTYNTQLITPKTYKSVYMVGAVPIYQEITFTVDAELEAMAEGSITATSDLTTSFELEAGVEYDGTSWNPITKDKFTKDYTATIEAAGGVNVKVRLIPNIEVKFYKAASAGLSVEPWLEGDLKASATAIYNTDFADSDALGIHKLETLNMDVGLEAKVYADLSIWKANIAHYPSEGGKKTIFNPTLNVFSIPTISLANNGVDVCSGSSYKLNATITNPTSLIQNNFLDSSIQWIVFPSNGATITPTSSNTKEATFSFNKQDEYQVYMLGYSEKLGSIGKQYESFTVDTRACTIEVIDTTLPIFISSATVSVNENQTSALTLVATDETSAVTYAISGTDSGSFSVSPTGVVTFVNAPDYEIKTYYSFTATATDEALNVATQNITVNIIDIDESVPVTVEYNGVTYGTVTSPYTQKVWLDRNLGASQVCTALNDTACYGDYYQWGKNTDGHEKSTSATTSTQATDINNAGSSFITSSSTYNYDWAQAADSDGTLRTANWSKTDGTSVCPVGYRVPTITELQAETILASTAVTNNTDAFTNFLKLPSAGYRGSYSASMYDQGSRGVVWSSSVSGSYSNYLDFYSSDASMIYSIRASGFSVRCLKD